jgi:hypothetical protein
MLPLSVPLPFDYGLRTITQDHGEHLSSALRNFRWHPCGRRLLLGYVQTASLRAASDS